MMRCYRCGECKEDNRFRPNQPYWNRWCRTLPDNCCGTSTSV
ncbi:hypothetical protein V4W94_004122 [Escherichia coli]